MVTAGRLAHGLTEFELKVEWRSLSEAGGTLVADAVPRGQ